MKYWTDGNIGFLNTCTGVPAPLETGETLYAYCKF